MRDSGDIWECWTGDRRSMEVMSSGQYPLGFDLRSLEQRKRDEKVKKKHEKKRKKK